MNFNANVKDFLITLYPFCCFLTALPSFYLCEAFPIILYYFLPIFFSFVFLYWWNTEHYGIFVKLLIINYLYFYSMEFRWNTEHYGMSLGGIPNTTEWV
jgi:hypothetical protein